MEIITFAAIKGGVGKTTLSYNFAQYLAYSDKKVLMIDMDHQCNLSQILGVYDQENTVLSIFEKIEPLNIKDKVKIHNVDKNIDLISGFIRLDEYEKRMSTTDGKDMQLYMWLDDYYDEYDIGQYDYIVIDTHPDFSTSTRNAIVVSHKIISPNKPSGFSEDSNENIKYRIDKLKKELIDFKTRESFVTAELYFIGNMVKHNTKLSNDFKHEISKNNEFITYFPEKEIFTKSISDKKSIIKLMKDSSIYNKEKKFFKDFLESCKEIAEK
ncbi:ParA family protein [Staphylococcus agnetis]|uniref:ParA family protein n=1 Tax=Staphylococcus agnetis TaxID=985762 RepID=UPI00208E1951|nr:ParA family protein [Staphylococcus agnetis]MCO4356038.1 ParA family protein [Staphylococcus agnetis]MCO4365807.1 ParA family protein [Staphylococcus agnetis]